ncbi:hypothetical protein B0J11DRAFT_524303 [Dendryphion nanum]|uniref:Transmembrane protein n=1 Tax=Dendryphion nanum TaxID=256645 RepID=A0A9P9E037_9PLEO|nr:hypothetical protein B0J11DRAFT_524303 [Dendryphion nanum]
MVLHRLEMDIERRHDESSQTPARCATYMYQTCDLPVFYFPMRFFNPSFQLFFCLISGLLSPSTVNLLSAMDCSSTFIALFAFVSSPTVLVTSPCPPAFAAASAFLRWSSSHSLTIFFFICSIRVSPLLPP